MSKRVHDSDNSSDNDDDEQNETSGSPAKIQELDIDSENDSNDMAMMCDLPPHPQLKFRTIDEFSVHYAKEHTNRCISCGKNFPSAHLLSLHLDENHNPFREVLAAKGEKTYACFIEDCDRKCSNPQKRRRHLIDKHMFPVSYNFRVVDRGIDHSISLLHGLQKRRLSTSKSNHRSKCSISVPRNVTTDNEGSRKAVETNKSQGTLPQQDLAKSVAVINLDDSKGSKKE